MSKYIKIEKKEENLHSVTYQYSANNCDWGEFVLQKTDLTNIHHVKLAKNDINKKFLFCSFSAIRLDFNILQSFPEKTYYAA
ncbi:hypothetical protein RHO13_03945 [Orbus wheelerorum]|uniref:hypothetical protein n=1 Tax=Orbus wheelerorum TaxID=3074111 RepID=UPI00370D839C